MFLLWRSRFCWTFGERAWPETLKHICSFASFQSQQSTPLSLKWSRPLCPRATLQPVYWSRQRLQMLTKSSGHSLEGTFHPAVVADVLASLLPLIEALAAAAFPSDPSALLKGYWKKPARSSEGPRKRGCRPNVTLIATLKLFVKHINIIFIPNHLIFQLTFFHSPGCNIWKLDLF